MKHYSEYLVCATALASVSLLPSAFASDENGASPTKASTTETVVVTDFRGRPPFKRSHETVDEKAEFARFEQEDAQSSDEGEVWVVDTRGRPPFKRTLVSADALADAARFEETDASAVEKPTRRGPPGKPTSRR